MDTVKGFLQRIVECANLITLVKAGEDQPLEVWDTKGHRYAIKEVYVEEGVLCIDIEREGGSL